MLWYNLFGNSCICVMFVHHLILYLVFLILQVIHDTEMTVLYLIYITVNVAHCMQLCTCQVSHILMWNHNPDLLINSFPRVLLVCYTRYCTQTLLAKMRFWCILCFLSPMTAMKMHYNDACLVNSILLEQLDIQDHLCMQTLIT